MVIAVALLAGFLIWLLLVRGDDDSGTTEAEPLARTAVSRAELAALAEEVGHPIYWAGPEKGDRLEVARNTEGETFLRYLTGGAAPGDRSERFLTIGTYPFPGAEARLEELAQDEGSLTNSTPDGGFVLTNESNPTSVYIAYPGIDLQIEVYDPDPERAFKVATSGDVVPVQ